VATAQAEVVRLEVAGRVAVVTIDYPPVNAFGRPVREGLIQVFAKINDLAIHDAEVRAVILTAAGERAFCAGADLRARTSETPAEDRHIHARRSRVSF